MDNPLFDFSALPERKTLRLPGGARLAVWLGVNIEHYVFGRPAFSLVPEYRSFVPDPINHGWRDYGLRVGIWRLLGLLEGAGVPGTAVINAVVCRDHPTLVAELQRLGWGWVAHGWDNSTLQVEMAEEEEAEYIARVTDTIESAAGHRPRGWLGAARSSTLNTHRLLAALGYTHLLDWSNDDQPYGYNVPQGRLASVPYSIEVNDIVAFAIHGQTGPDFERMVLDQFECLYDEGASSARVMGLSLHPFLIGQSFRAKYLARALARMREASDVWWTTSEEVAAWFLDH